MVRSKFGFGWKVYTWRVASGCYYNLYSGWSCGELEEAMCGLKGGFCKAAWSWEIMCSVQATEDPLTQNTLHLNNCDAVRDGTVGQGA